MRILICILSFMVSSIAQAEGGDCSLTRMLYEPGKHKACQKKFIDAISDAQDKAEAKNIFKNWKPAKNLTLRIGPGYLLVKQGHKTLMNALWLKRDKPSILWLNGKILIDKSDNPSFGRRIDNMLKSRTGKTAAFSALFLPQAFAAADNSGRDLLFLYTIDTPGGPAGTVRHMTSMFPDSNALTEFLPRASFYGFFGSDKIKCEGDTVETQKLKIGDGYGNGGSVEMIITPKSPTEFIVKSGGKTQLIDIGPRENPGRACADYSNAALEPFCQHVWEDFVKTRPHLEEKEPRLARCLPLENDDREACEAFFANHVSLLNREFKTIHAGMAGKQATIAICRDEKCEATDKQKPFSSFAPVRARTKAPAHPMYNAVANLNGEIRDTLAKRLFGLSVLGNCCAHHECRSHIAKKYSLELVPATEGSKAKADR